jgi:hypothetical protein
MQGTSGQGATGGTNAIGPNSKGDVDLANENRMLDKKLKSICKGC